MRMRETHNMTQSEESIILNTILLSSLITVTDPSHSFRMTFNVLYKDHGVGRQKELLAHIVRLRYFLVVII